MGMLHHPQTDKGLVYFHLATPHHQAELNGGVCYRDRKDMRVAVEGDKHVEDSGSWIMSVRKNKEHDCEMQNEERWTSGTESNYTALMNTDLVNYQEHTCTRYDFL